MGFYGPSYFQKRCKAWTNLLTLLKSIVGSWLCFGDFNLILDAKEKSGGRVGSSLLIII